MFNEVTLNEEVFQYFAGDPRGPLLLLPRLMDREDDPILGPLEDQLERYPKRKVEETRADSEFQFHHSKYTEPELTRRARGWLLIQHLNRSIPRRRIQMLKDQESEDRPAPYAHPVLEDVEVDSEYLVSLSGFKVRCGAAIHAEWAFGLVPPVRSPNANWWLAEGLPREGLGETRVRLDPLQHRPVEEYPFMEYRMWQYGRQLDWQRIEGLHQTGEVDHGRWIPGKFTERQGVAKTEFAWIPRGSGEIHFHLEEVPSRKVRGSRGSRYVHAIYRPDDRRFIHLDGAVRIFDQRQLESRLDESSHVKDTDKLGVRVKLSRVDSVITRQAFMNFLVNFYVWNYDVSRYCGVNVPDEM